jgi:hypothetical protein
MFQIWGQVADVMQVTMVAALFVVQLGIYCFFIWRRAYSSGRLLEAIGETSYDT